MIRRTITVKLVLAWVGILAVLGGFVTATWYGVSQVLLAPVVTSVQRGLDDVADFADTVDGVTGTTDAEIGRGPSTEPDRDGYVVVTLDPELSDEDTATVAGEFVDWLDDREEVSQVRLHVTLDRGGNRVGITTAGSTVPGDLNEARLGLLSQGTADTDLTAISVRGPVVDGQYNLDDTNDTLRVVLTPRPGVDTVMLRDRWTGQLRAVSGGGKIIIDETSAIPAE